ncbi:hypothetical protein EJ06DRAFT_533118 [Trichodelitschia bisporula]|uniref:Protein YAE1 n=1 Tax=Trichodelitschia bisporula TaxID=703511 RepID=A0A6G1HNM7_9PEZI|nr:hypothetical protein EJ06DRAFT_533118 [Trichodelitschia bisporula]
MLIDTFSRFSSVPSPPADAPPPSPPQAEADDDVFATGPSEISDIPRLQATHHTSGYRDGISASKAEHVQAGFDEGFALGAELGAQVGWCIGVVEGLARGAREEDKEQLQGEAGRVREELDMKRVFGREWFGEDGVWRFDVPGDEGEITFREVARAHPLVRRWVERAKRLADELGVDLEVLKGEEGEEEA